MGSRRQDGGGEMTKFQFLRSLFLLSCVQARLVRRETSSLIEAAQHGNLVAAGANVNTRDSEGWSPLHWAAYRGHMEVVQELVGGGVDINLTTKLDRNTKKRYTAWDLASMYGHSEVADFLRSQPFFP